MNNLSIDKYLITPVCKSEADSVLAICHDSINGLIYSVSSAGSDEISISSCRTGCATSSTQIPLAPSQRTGDSSIPLILDFRYLSDKESLFLATRDGDMFLIRPVDDEWIVDSLGYIDSGLDDCKWSPDEEHLLLCTGGKSVMMMTREFDLIGSEIHSIACTAEFGSAEFINVGWGSKETQFHGSIGRDAALERAQLTKQARISPRDFGRMICSWRGDGAYFCVSCLSQLPESESEITRLIRVYDRDTMQLVSTSEVVADLEQVVSWKPAGSLITSVQSAAPDGKHGNQVVFFEKNGLRHGEFLMQFPTADEDWFVSAVEWNADSTLLLVVLSKGSFESTEKVVQIWSTANYHWYLKYSSHINGSVAMWDHEQSMRLHFVSDTNCHSMDLSFAIHKSLFPAHGNDTAVAQIDGKTLHLTPFSRAMVPPPMSFKQYKMPSSEIRNVSFANHGSGNDCIVVCNDNSVHFIIDGQLRSGRIADNECRPLGVAKQILWPSENRCFILSVGAEGDLLTALDLDFDKTDCVQMQVISNMLSHSGVAKMSLELKSSTLYLVDYHATVSSVTVNANGFLRSQRCSELVKLPRELQIYTDDEGELHIVYLAARSRHLYLDSHLLASNCNSFHLRNDVLIYATQAHEMQFVPTHTFTAIKQDSANADFSHFTRKLERGSQIVTVLHNDTGVILQLPRGNLEIIHPRPLVIAAIMSAIDSLDFKSALTLTRKHRIDMNILCDYSPQLFLQNIDEFVAQIDNVDYLNLFLSELRNENSMLKFPQHFFKKSSGENMPESDQQDKVNTVCKSVRDSLVAMTDNLPDGEETKYLNAILITFVRQSPPMLEEMLNEIATLSEPDQKESALQFIKVFVNIDMLYNVALGMYDFELTSLVAQQTNMDPREYLPFIAQLQSYELQPYQRFKIDEHLKRNEKAIENLAKCGTEYEDECVDFISRKPQLFKYALQMYAMQQNGRMYRRIAGEYALYLEAQGKNHDAGMAYSCAAEHRKAADCFKRCGGESWRQCLIAASQPSAEMSEDEYKELALDLAKELEDQVKYAEAAVVYRDHLCHSPGAVEMLIKSQSWLDAWTLALRHRHYLLINERLVPAINEHFRHLLAEIKAIDTAVSPVACRLVTVRAEKNSFQGPLFASTLVESDPFTAGGNENNENNNNNGDVEVDVMTDTASTTMQTLRTRTTGTSRTGRSSTRSARSRRKQDRKRQQCKPGSPFEEQALLNQLVELVGRCNRLQLDISRLVEVMMLFKSSSNYSNNESYDDGSGGSDGGGGGGYHRECTLLQTSFETMKTRTLIPHLKSLAPSSDTNQTANNNHQKNGNKGDNNIIMKVPEPIAPHLIPPLVKRQLEQCLQDGGCRALFELVVCVYAGVPVTALGGNDAIGVTCVTVGNIGALGGLGGVSGGSSGNGGNGGVDMDPWKSEMLL